MKAERMDLLFNVILIICAMSMCGGMVGLLIGVLLDSSFLTWFSACLLTIGTLLVLIGVFISDLRREK